LRQDAASFGGSSPGDSWTNLTEFLQVSKLATISKSKALAVWVLKSDILYCPQMILWSD
jgi:hypothetical protein